MEITMSERSRCFDLLFFVSFALILAGLTAPWITARSTAVTPAISMRRLSTVNFAVVPGDFNGDGIVDLASTASGAGARPIIVALGNGDGTFNAPKAAPANGVVLTAGDFNKDGKLDLVVSDASDLPLKMLIGHGDGTFAAPAQIGGAIVVVPTFAVTADFDRDGNLDLAVGIVDGDIGDDAVLLYRGRGDGTFTDAGAKLATGAGSNPQGAVATDLNGDGRTDLAVASHDAQTLSIFLNQGAFNFVASSIPLAEQANDVAAADLNHDGKMDLVVATSTAGSDDLYYITGSVKVLRGNGNGTFQTPVNYDTAPGAWKVVAGDFNRDGIADVATANRSSKLGVDFCGQIWDSVTILPGVGDGRLAPAAASSFSLGNQSDPNYDRFRNDVRSLAVADVNRDGAPDLVSSWGAILMNHAPDTNWAPTVNAGSDQTIAAGESMVFAARANDVDQDMLTYAWSDSGGHAIEPSPAPCLVTPANPGVYTMTVTVDDGRGHQASDSFTYTVTGAAVPTVSVTAPAGGDVLAAGTPYTIRWTATAGGAPIDHFSLLFSDDGGASGGPIAECSHVAAAARSCSWNNPTVTERGQVVVVANDTNGRTGSGESGIFAVRTSGPSSTPLGNGWSHADVGSVGAAGSATHDGFINNGQGLTIRGSGADIWGPADEFHFAWQHVTDDFSIDTRVDSVTNTNAWTKAGLMIRANASDASSPHASIFVSPSKGIAYQRRITQSGTSQSTAGPALTAPVWLRMTRQGGIITALYRKNATDAWTVLGRQNIAAFATAALDVGLAVSSHADGSLATAKFTGVFLAPLTNFNSVSMGDGFGDFTTDGTTYTMTVAGTDIWGTSDGGIYSWIPTGDFNQITIRVRSIGNTDPWAKAGVMIREGQTANARHADAIVSPGKGVAMQYRSTTGGPTASAVQISGSAPIWLRIRRSESATAGGPTGFQATYSTDFQLWRILSNSVSFPMTHDALIGIVGTSHKPGVKTTIIMDDVRIER
jgi:regulation of enolase protein 1 (concanavalin A-like superfamily)